MHRGLAQFGIAIDVAITERKRIVRVALSLSDELRVRAEQLYRAARSGVKHYIGVFGLKFKTDCQISAC
ncbi:hypothetical protein Tco_0995682 [Tanacetum coccineum]